MYSRSHHTLAMATSMILYFLCLCTLLQRFCQAQTTCVSNPMPLFMKFLRIIYEVLL